MPGLALRSLRKRAGGFAASFMAMLFGAAMVMAFASMLDVSDAGNASGAAAETLTIMALVVGGWSTLLVILAVASTLTLSIRQRAEEMALLKSVGATPAQIRRMVVGEAAGLAVAAWALAVVPALLGGRAVLSMLRSTGQVPESIGYAFGPVALGMGLGTTLVSAVAAALVAVRRTARARVAESLADAAPGTEPIGWKRMAGAAAALLVAVSLTAVTLTVMRDKGFEAMGSAVQADIFAALGLALLAPWLIRRAAGMLAGPLGRLGVAGDLAVATLRRRTGQMAGVVMPVILFTGAAVGTLYAQEIENDAMAAAGLASTLEQKNVATLNYVVIGMMLAFTALMLVNTLIAVTAYRRREFGQQRLAGATPGQVVGAVALEAALLLTIGLVFGTVASVFTVIPYSVARTGAVLPDLGPLTFAGIVAIAAVLTMGTSVAAARRAMRVPAVEAVAG